MAENRLHELVRGGASRQEILEAVEIPEIAWYHARETDAAADAPLLYAIALLAEPKLMVELGTRQGVTARTLACAAFELGARFVTIDPDPSCRSFLRGVVPHEFIEGYGEAVYARGDVPSCDLLHVDTDPHTYDQTKMWLETWVENRLNPGGVAAFHDVIPARPEIQVAEAVRDWVAAKPEWFWLEYPGTQGLGVLLAPLS